MKETHDLCFKFGEFEGKDDAARMQDEVEAPGQQIDMAAESLSHAALDAIAFMGFAQHFADGETNARACGLAGERLGSEKPAHGRGLAFAGGGVGALIIGVLPQAQRRERGARGWLGWGVHRECRLEACTGNFPAQQKTRED
jgi:hypothetical protein